MNREAYNTLWVPRRGSRRKIGRPTGEDFWDEVMFKVIDDGAKCMKRFLYLHRINTAFRTKERKKSFRT